MADSAKNEGARHRNLVVQIREVVGAFKVMLSCNSSLPPHVLVDALENILIMEEGQNGRPENVQKEVESCQTEESSTYVDLMSTPSQSPPIVPSSDDFDEGHHQMPIDRKKKVKGGSQNNFKLRDVRVLITKLDVDKFKALNPKIRVNDGVKVRRQNVKSSSSFPSRKRKARKGQVKKRKDLLTSDTSSSGDSSNKSSDREVDDGFVFVQLPVNSTICGSLPTSNKVSIIPNVIVTRKPSPEFLKQLKNNQDDDYKDSDN